MLKYLPPLPITCYTYTAQHHNVQSARPYPRTVSYSCRPPLEAYSHSLIIGAVSATASTWLWTCCSLALFAVEMAVTATYARHSYTYPQILSRIVNLPCNTDAVQS